MDYRNDPTRLALGTVQFGTDYGVAGNRCVPFDEMENILNLARGRAIDTLDTAPVYGTSEEKIGLYVKQYSPAFKIISKLPAFQAMNNQEAHLDNVLRVSLKNLNISSLYALLFHRSEDLLSQQGESIYRLLTSYRDDGLIGSIGVSVYGPEEINNVLEYFDIDMVQLPFNIFDQRLVQGSMLEKLKRKNIKIHVRSVFLQGLLLLDQDVPDYFSPWKKLLSRFRQKTEEHDMCALQACLKFVFSFRDIDRIIIGVNSAEQLSEIIDSLSSDNTSPDFSELACDEQALINPSRWCH